MAPTTIPPSLPDPDGDAAEAYSHLQEMQASHDAYLASSHQKSYASVVDATAQILTARLLQDAIRDAAKKGRVSTLIAGFAAIVAAVGPFID